MKKLAVIQSNYIPWKGYFDLINQVDECILYDNTQYTVRSWRSRNRIKTPSGLQWLVIPVFNDYHQPKRICDTHAVDHHWRKKHWKNWLQHYGKAPYFEAYKKQFEALYLEQDETNLSDINYRFIMQINDILGITTPVIRFLDDRLDDDKDIDIIKLCKQSKATAYLSGPMAKAWIKVENFQKEGIELEWMNYDNYSEYPQFYPPFQHAVSILDLIFHTGPLATRYMKSFAGKI